MRTILFLALLSTACGKAGDNSSETPASAIDTAPLAEADQTRLTVASFVNQLLVDNKAFVSKKVSVALIYKASFSGDLAKYKAETSVCMKGFAPLTIGALALLEGDGTLEEALERLVVNAPYVFTSSPLKESLIQGEDDQDLTHYIWAFDMGLRKSRVVKPDSEPGEVLCGAYKSSLPSTAGISNRGVNLDAYQAFLNTVAE